MEVTVYGQLRGATGDKTVEVDFDGGTVREAIDALVTAYPRAERHLFRDTDRIDPSVRISMDGERVGLEDQCPPEAALSIHPAMQGG